jgi:hypothetical protein
LVSASILYFIMRSCELRNIIAYDYYIVFDQRKIRHRLSCNHRQKQGIFSPELRDQAQCASRVGRHGGTDLRAYTSAGSKTILGCNVYICANNITQPVRPCSIRIKSWRRPQRCLARQNQAFARYSLGSNFIDTFFFKFVLGIV